MSLSPYPQRRDLDVGQHAAHVLGGRTHHDPEADRVERQHAGAELHWFLGTRSGRESRYARLLAGAVNLARVPRPLDRVLAYT